jgi:hypothetical protein
LRRPDLEFQNINCVTLLVALAVQNEAASPPIRGCSLQGGGTAYLHQKDYGEDAVQIGYQLE